MTEHVIEYENEIEIISETEMSFLPYGNEDNLEEWEHDMVTDFICDLLSSDTEIGIRKIGDILTIKVNITIEDVELDE